MFCIDHNDRNAVNTCAKCGAGLCNDCVTGSVFRNDNNQPFCKKCNYEIACEDDRSLNALLKSKQIILYIYSGVVAIGLVYFLVNLIIGNRDKASIIMLLIWACGSIANFFDKNSMIRRLLSNISNSVKEAVHSHSIPLFIGSILGVALGTVFGVFLMGIVSPILIVAYLIGIHKVKKQIASNNEILSQFQTENSQN